MRLSDRQLKKQKQSETSPTTVQTPPPSGIIVPLYIYPLSPTTWDPLYDSISANPDVHFLVIVNPNSGPGASPLPDANYVREVARLNRYANVVTVGYIAIDYCKKPLPEALEEVQTYATWAEDYVRTGLGVGGIFLDETPNLSSSEAVEYLAILQDRIKSTPGLLGNRLNRITQLPEKGEPDIDHLEDFQVIQNPGTPPDAPLANIGPDLILTCEEPYSRYRSNEVQRRLRQLHYDRTRSGYVIHSVPPDDLRPLVLELRHRAAYLFVTEFFGEFYERFGPNSWPAMVEASQSEA
ncbi:cell surface spherulin 4-like protein [Aspergillus bombycis]|uniref:Cell surface spherulin 4-like protein n=1 Tax=Aspergillus bombycis TaxID=109264 RepID=A0A1F7ZS30_9EURO|nr:cell surface spherulin 4-like protein [Aspergillus bombycis]OGM42252.1 cell surface spherulin 4-like protein [Aspergillus bombycis]